MQHHILSFFKLVFDFTKNFKIQKNMNALICFVVLALVSSGMAAPQGQTLQSTVQQTNDQLNQALQQAYGTLNGLGNGLNQQLQGLLSVNPLNLQGVVQGVDSQRKGLERAVQANIQSLLMQLQNQLQQSPVGNTLFPILNQMISYIDMLSGNLGQNLQQITSQAGRTLQNLPNNLNSAVNNNRLLTNLVERQ